MQINKKNKPIEEQLDIERPIRSKSGTEILFSKIRRWLGYVVRQIAVTFSRLTKAIHDLFFSRHPSQQSNSAPPSIPLQSSTRNIVPSSGPPTPASPILGTAVAVNAPVLKLGDALPWNGSNCYLIAATEALLAVSPQLAQEHSIDGSAGRYLRRALELSQKRSSGNDGGEGNQLVELANTIIDPRYVKEVGKFGDPLDLLDSLLAKSNLPKGQLLRMKNGKARPLQCPQDTYQCNRSEEEVIAVQRAINGEYKGLQKLVVDQSAPPEFFAVSFREKGANKKIHLDPQITIHTIDPKHPDPRQPNEEDSREIPYHLKSVVVYVNENHYYSLEACYSVEGEIVEWIKRDMGHRTTIAHSPKISQLIEKSGDIFLYERQNVIES